MTRLAVILAAMVIALLCMSVLVGPAGLPAGESLRALFGGGDTPIALVMREIRLPRAILAAAVGAGLGLSGAAMQGYLRNPLADPGLIGVSASAALGAVLAIQTGMAAAIPFGLPLAALIGAVIAVALVLALAGPRGGSITLILGGVAVSSLAAALTSLVLNLSPNPFAANEIIFWMMGSLADRSLDHMWLALPLIALGAGVLFTLGRGLDALTLGEDAAQSMGFNLIRLRLMLVFGVACIVGASTAVAGAIGFIGLVVPHILRPFVGARPSALLWASGLGGAVLLISADIAVRVVLPARDLKLGVLIALIGAPLFLHLIYKLRRESL
jgi:iron complex transport system permease protein